MLNTAAGIIYTAFCDEETRRQILSSMGQDPVSPTLHSLDPEALAQTLEKMQKKGFAFAEHNITWNWADRTSALAVPIFSEGFLFGALSLRFFREKTSDDEVLNRCLSKMIRASTSIGLLLREMRTD
jgi:IclR family mhp operon transcriptional activator